MWTGRGCPADRGCSEVTRCGEVRTEDTEAVQMFVSSHNIVIGWQVEVPAAHLAACLLCNQTTGECMTEGGAGAGQGAELLLYVSSALSPLCRESATLSHAGHCTQVTQLLVTLCMVTVLSRWLVTQSPRTPALTAPWRGTSTSAPTTWTPARGS